MHPLISKFSILEANSMWKKHISNILGKFPVFPLLKKWATKFPVPPVKWQPCDLYGRVVTCFLLTGPRAAVVDLRPLFQTEIWGFGYLALLRFHHLSCLPLQKYINKKLLYLLINLSSGWFLTTIIIMIISDCHTCSYGGLDLPSMSRDKTQKWNKIPFYEWI